MTKHKKPKYHGSLSSGLIQILPKNLTSYRRDKNVQTVDKKSKTLDKRDNKVKAENQAQSSRTLDTPAKIKRTKSERQDLPYNLLTGQVPLPSPLPGVVMRRKKEVKELNPEIPPRRESLLMDEPLPPPPPPFSPEERPPPPPLPSKQMFSPMTGAPYPPMKVCDE